MLTNMLFRPTVSEESADGKRTFSFEQKVPIPVSIPLITVKLDIQNSGVVVDTVFSYETYRSLT